MQFEFIAGAPAPATSPIARIVDQDALPGGLDPVRTRDAYFALFGSDLPPVTVLRPEQAPTRSGAEMDALIAQGHVAHRHVPGALSPHEEYAEAVGAAIHAPEPSA